MLFIKVLNKKCKTFIVFDDMIADILRNKKLNLAITKWFIRGRKLKKYFVFITQSYFSLPKSIRLNFGNYANYKQTNPIKIQQIAFNHMPDIGSRTL